MAIVVDDPIVNSPFASPARHYRSHGGIPELVDGRRASGYMPGLRTRGGQGTLLEEEFVELQIVNHIRERVGRWREAGHPGASRTTLELLNHWRERGEDERRLFFCQLEAVETAIWLVEGPMAETSRLPLEQQERYARHCLKMATGAGKTVVMAMLIAWSLLNKARQPQDRRFSDAVLVVCPNLTVKERLEVLKPAAPGNYYEAFDLIPPGLRSGLLGGRVMVTNWHAWRSRTIRGDAVWSSVGVRRRQRSRTSSSVPSSVPRATSSSSTTRRITPGARRGKIGRPPGRPRRGPSRRRAARQTKRRRRACGSTASP